MGHVRPVEPVMLLVAAFSRLPDALDWAGAALVARHGPVVLSSARFEFTDTAYYEPTMGTGLRKQFLAFERLIEPDELVGIKLQTNALEAAYARDHPGAAIRPLNLDPGYLASGKLVLASTKDFAHRIYLARGIYAEVTLQYRHGEFVPGPWTFPDYRRDDYRAFLREARQAYRRLLRRSAGAGASDRRHGP